MTSELINEKVFITGGTGFLGKCVLNNLILSGAKPYVLTRHPSTAFLEHYGERISPLVGDLLDYQNLEVILRRVQPDKIIHLAGVLDRNAGQPVDLEKNNYEATARLLELAREIRVKRIIITGTADEYGFQASPQKEILAAMPASDYAVSKNKAVRYALELHGKYELPVVILRPFTVYGVGQSEAMFVSQAVRCAVENLPFEMSEGVQKRDLVFVTDFANAMMKALQVENIEGEIYNVGSGTAVALRDLAEKIWNLAGADFTLLKIGARHTNQNELHNTQADISKIRAALKWKPKVNLEQGLKNIIENRKLLKAFK